MRWEETHILSGGTDFDRTPAVSIEWKPSVFLVLPRFFYRSSSPPPSVVLSLLQLFQLFHRHLGLATEENNASSCWRWQMRSLRAVVRPLSIKVKKRARRRFIGDRPCCQLSALCNLNLLQNDNVKAEKVFHCQFSERREVKETVNH